MSTITTFRLWLEPDDAIPGFQRLRWETMDVPIADVLLHGVHPWRGPNEHPSLEQEFLSRLNNTSVKPEGLAAFGLARDALPPNSYYTARHSRFEQLLDTIRKTIYFMRELGYVELIDLARSRLRNRWNHETARSLAEKAYPGFHEVRQFLKSRDKQLKLSGYDDLGRYDLSRVLSLEDFADRDSLLIAEGIPTPNFRTAQALQRVTDGEGRLALVPEIQEFSIASAGAWDHPYLHGAHLTWHVTRAGQTLTFHPDLGSGASARVSARAFAERWRTDHGRLVFRTSIERMGAMVEGNEAIPSFPRLQYTHKVSGHATAQLAAGHVDAFHIGGYPTDKLNGAQIREILRAYGVSMTGTKDALVDKLATLTARTYAEKEPFLDAYFRTNRLMLVARQPTASAKLIVFEDAPTLHNLLLTMYALRHLRGNAILEPGHENATYSIDELALALVCGKVSLAGAFIRVA